MPQNKPVYSPRTTTGFFCPYCGRSLLPSARLSYPAEVVGKFAPVYRCSCGKHIGEPVGMVQLTRKPA
jgi:hypothetical protein